jgi:hypothetical protein
VLCASQPLSLGPCLSEVTRVRANLREHAFLFLCFFLFFALGLVCVLSFVHVQSQEAVACLMIRDCRSHAVTVMCTPAFERFFMTAARFQSILVHEHEGEPYILARWALWKGLMGGPGGLKRVTEGEEGDGDPDDRDDDDAADEDDDDADDVD